MVEEKRNRRSILYYVFEKIIEDNPMSKEAEERIRKTLCSELEKLAGKKNTS